MMATAGGISSQRLRTARRMLKFSRRLKRSRLRVPAAVIRAAALGVLRSQDLDAFVSETYSSDADFYHPDIRQDIYEQRIVSVLRMHTRGDRLLDAFCGQGREARILAEVGFKVTGIDCLSEMIEGARNYAKRNRVDAEFLVADFNAFEDPLGEGFDIVYTSAWMFSTCPTIQRRQEFLNKCASLCKPGGIIVISYESPSSSSPLQEFILDLTARLSSIVTRGYRNFENGDRLGEAGLFWHLFSKREALKEVAAAELEVLHADESADGLLDFLLLTRI